MFRSNLKWWLVVSVGILFLGGLSLQAQESSPSEKSPPQEASKQAPTQPQAGSSFSQPEEINGTCDELEEDGESGITRLIGHVRIVRANGYLNADGVTIYRDADRRVLRTVAEGHVDMKEGDLSAVCEKAVFDEVNNLVILTGSVVVFQKSDRVEAEEVVLDRTTNKRKFRGGVKFRVAIQTTRQESSAQEAPAQETSAQEKSAQETEETPTQEAQKQKQE